MISVNGVFFGITSGIIAAVLYGIAVKIRNKIEYDYVIKAVARTNNTVQDFIMAYLKRWDDTFQFTMGCNTISDEDYAVAQRLFSLVIDSIRYDSAVMVRILKERYALMHKHTFDSVLFRHTLMWHFKRKDLNNFLLMNALTKCLFDRYCPGRLEAGDVDKAVEACKEFGTQFLDLYLNSHNVKREESAQVGG